MDPRLQAVYHAAAYLFITKGYDSTHVAQIAEAANIGTGTIYNLFTGKKAILHYVLLYTLDRRCLDGDLILPVHEVDSDLIIQNLLRVVAELFAKIELKYDKDGIKPSFGAMLSILFDYAACYNVALNIINNNPSALEEVEKVYRRKVNYLYRVITYNLTSYMEQGEIRKIELPELHIRNILEGITWWAMYLPYQVKDIDIPVSKAKEIALDVLTQAYLAK